MWWDYLAYALFVVVMVACLRYVMNGLEPEKPRPKRPPAGQ
jgi:hypothetical protein